MPALPLYKLEELTEQAFNRRGSTSFNISVIAIMVGGLPVMMCSIIKYYTIIQNKYMHSFFVVLSILKYGFDVCMMNIRKSIKSNPGEILLTDV